MINTACATIFTSAATRPIHENERQHDEEIGPDFHKRRNLANNYLHDRDSRNGEKPSPGMGQIFLIHDSCATESMGPIYDRSQEHLGVSDITVIAVRRFLLHCVRALQSGKEPPHVIRTAEQNDLRHVACIATKSPQTAIRNSTSSSN